MANYGIDKLEKATKGLASICISALGGLLLLLFQALRKNK